MSEVNLCFNCKRSLTEDHFCHGCKEYVCAICDETMAFGDHKKEDHLDNGDMYEW
jgi:hypothetical protein